MNLDPQFLDIAACPQCHAPLRESPAADAPDTGDGELICTSTECGLAYPVRDDIPILLIDEARRPA